MVKFGFIWPVLDKMDQEKAAKNMYALALELARDSEERSTFIRVWSAETKAKNHFAFAVTLAPTSHRVSWLPESLPDTATGEGMTR